MQLRGGSQANRTIWLITTFFFLVPPGFPGVTGTAPESDTAWNWACDHLDDCRRQIFGDAERWRVIQLPVRGSVTLVIEMGTDDFLDVRVIGSYTGRKLAYTQILVAEEAPIFDQLRRLRDRLPEATPEEIFNKVRVREFHLGDEKLEELQRHLDQLRSTEIRVPWDQSVYTTYVHGLDATLFVDFGVDDYSFNLNMPRTRDPIDSSSLTSLGKWAWQFARWLDATVGLSVK